MLGRKWRRGLFLECRTCAWSYVVWIIRRHKPSQCFSIWNISFVPNPAICSIRPLSSRWPSDFHHLLIQKSAWSWQPLSCRKTLCVGTFAKYRWGWRCRSSLRKCRLVVTVQPFFHTSASPLRCHSSVRIQQTMGEITVPFLTVFLPQTSHDFVLGRRHSKLSIE